MARYKIGGQYNSEDDLQQKIHSRINSILKCQKQTQQFLQNDSHLQTSDVLSIHSILYNDSNPEPLRFRTTSVKLGNDSYHQVFLVPLEAQHIEMYMEDLLSFLAAGDVPAIIKSAIFYTQFLKIHPFVDGNGRSSRFISNLLLLRGNHIKDFYFSISPMLEEHQFEYMKTSHLILEQGDWRPYLDFFLKRLEALLKKLEFIIDELINIERRLLKEIRIQYNSRVCRLLLDSLYLQPVGSKAKLRKDLDINPIEFQRIFSKLLKSGLIKIHGDEYNFEFISRLFSFRDWKSESVISDGLIPPGLVPMRNL